MPDLGQHFLTDDAYLERIVDAGDVAVGDQVLEIGPGRGELTHHLLQRGAHVTAIEVDRALARQLDRQLADDPDAEVVHGDAAEIDWPEAHKLVANLPYQISSPVVERFVHSDLELAVLTVQRAFAERLAADPAEEETSRLTIGTQLYADVELLFDVPRGAFDPPPDVRSSVVHLEPRDPPKVAAPDLLEEVLDHVFTQKRKMLRSSLKEWEGAREALEELDLSTTRPGRVPVDTWPKLADRIAEKRDP